MAGKDIILMSQRELKRLHIVHKVIDKRLKQKDAGSILGLSDRQIRRIISNVKQHGDPAIIHCSRGKPSNRTLPQDIKKRTIKLYREKYHDFGPTLANEKLFEIDKIKIADQTLRNWLMENNAWTIKRKQRKHRQWRQRKHSFGEMVQLDGSHHAWLEARGPHCVLMGYIDDATGKIYARFYEYEGTIPAMDSFKRYITRYGIPQSIYLDRHSTYKSTAKLNLEDELNNAKALSQFEGALKELGVDVIHANSPQAKGRIERSFKTHQDRLVKELRLANISTIKDANILLGSYIGRHNAKFAVTALKPTNLHRPVPKDIDLDRVFSIKDKAALRNDFTIQHNNRFYQILEPTQAKEVTVEERLNGKLYIYYKDSQLKYKLIDKRPQKPKQKLKQRKPRYILPHDHPYRLFRKFRMRKAS
jgi:hypothetical protein